MGKSTSFRVGKVRADLRGKTWYLTYLENGRRLRPRVGTDRDAARQLAAQVNAQLEVSAPTAFSFESIRIDELQQRWLDHHEQVLRSSLHTIRRYRTATQHLLTFIEKNCPTLKTAQIGTRHAEQFVRYLRSIQVSPNGHENSAKRPLMDNGVRYILETCRSLFVFAAKRRHLSPYSDNPFASLDLDRIPIDDAKPIIILTAEQEMQFLRACDDWQVPLFLTLMLTGMRPGELIHLLLPDDVDLDQGVICIRNKPRLGWQVKTRTERDIPMVGVLVDVLRRFIGNRTDGPLIRRRGLLNSSPAFDETASRSSMEETMRVRVEEAEYGTGLPTKRSVRQALSRAVWRQAGAIRTDCVRREMMRITKQIGLPELTSPKALRHLFATSLQDGNVDPIIRCEIMGHSVGGRSGAGLGMTANYTHTRPETKRRQLEQAQANRSAVRFARLWLRQASSAETLD